jgi:hypothetical protein
MLYELTYQRDRRSERFVGTRAQAQALADYLARTFGIVPQMRRA